MTVEPTEPSASHLQPSLPHRHPRAASAVLSRADGRARDVERRRPSVPPARPAREERALAVDLPGRSGRDKRQRAPPGGYRIAIPIGFHIGARPEPAVIHLFDAADSRCERSPRSRSLGRLPN